ncbi:MAG: IS4 family transposase [Lachnospiraceae bacterium]|nr:IS4 family transposase [Candidatus Equihabitans merdae]
MNDYPKKVKEKLDSIINEMAQTSWLYASNPGHDFVRQDSGKLSFSDTVKSILTMGKGSLSDEMEEYFDLSVDDIPSNSAFVQRRQQIQLSAFHHLFTEFSSSFPEVTRKFNGYTIAGIDGTHIVYSTNGEILEDFNKPKLIDRKGYNHMHLNAFVDTLSKVMLDIVIQPGQQPDERDALHTMLDRYHPDDPSRIIITADRGYESYDSIFHCLLLGFGFVFRMKAPDSCTSILSSFSCDLPDDQGEFDVITRRFLTDSKNKIIKQQDDVYVYMNPNKNIPHFYKLLRKHIYVLTLRVVKVKTGDNSFEYLVTNLPYSEFSTDDIRDIYHLRWGAEISFRYLKHAAGLLHFHTRKPELVKQEIYARLTYYNAGIILANIASDEKRAKSKPRNTNKFLYEVDFSQSIKTVRKYLLRRPDRREVDLIRLLMKHTHAVKEAFRSFERHLRGIGAICFLYR